jgi:UDP-arabinose 4-epimerase
MASNLKIMRISLIASIISFYIWQINFGVPSVQSARRAPINDDVLFSIPEGKLHVLVTGGAGYIGSHAALALLEQGHAVTVLDNLSRGNYGAIDKLHQLFPHSLRFHYMDLGDKPLLESIFLESKNPIDLVIHFAAVAYVGESVAEPLRYYENITVNTVHVLEAMKAANVKNLVYSSTCAVYGNPDKLPVTEATPPKPINPYGEAKLYAENVIRNYAKADTAFKAVILRLVTLLAVPLAMHHAAQAQAVMLRSLPWTWALPPVTGHELQPVVETTLACAVHGISHLL